MLSVLPAAQDGRALRHARAAHGVGDQRDLRVVLRLHDQPEQLRRQMNAVCDELDMELIEQIGALHHAQHAHPAVPGDGRHAGIQMRHMRIAVLQALPDHVIGGVAMADGDEDALLREQIAQRHRALQLRRNGPAQNIAVAPAQNLLIVRPPRRHKVLRRLGASLRGREIRAFQMNAGKTRHVLRNPAGLLELIKEEKELLIRAGQRGRQHGRRAVRQMGARSPQDVLRRAVHKIAVPAAVAVQIDKAGEKNPSGAVHALSGLHVLRRFSLAHSGDSPVLHSEIAERNRFRFRDNLSVIK